MPDDAPINGAAASREERRREHLQTALRNALDRHGFGLHYAVLKAAADAYDAGPSQWVFKVSEFPVSVRGDETRIDFILSHGDLRPVYILAECKKANPAMSNWCFCKAPYTRRNAQNDALLLELIRLDDLKQPYATNLRVYAGTDKAYHLAFPVKLSNPGKPSNELDQAGGSPDGRSAIESACGQVARYLNGMVESFRLRPNQLVGLEGVVWCRSSSPRRTCGPVTST